MDPIFGKTANPPSIIQNLHVGAGLVGSGITAMEFPSHPTNDAQHTLYKQGPYPSLINKATLGKQHKNADGSAKIQQNFINPTITGNGPLFGIGQQHVFNPAKIQNSDARLTPKGEFSGNSSFFNYVGENSNTLISGRNSNIYPHDNILGKPNFSHNVNSLNNTKPKNNANKPQTYNLTPTIKNQNHKLPQVKYGQHDIPLFSVNTDFTQRDENITRQAKEDWTKNKHMPDESETKDFVNPVGKLDIPNDLSQLIDKTLNLRSPMSINESFCSSCNSDFKNLDSFENFNNNQEYKKEHFDKQQQKSKPKQILDLGMKNLITLGSKTFNFKFSNFSNNEFFINFSQNGFLNNNLSQNQPTPQTPQQTQKETFNKTSLNDSDELYQELLRSYAVSLNHYLNNSSKYKKWKTNWKILDDNLTKTNLSVKRLDSKDKDVAYTQNKGDIIKFRWRDTDTYIPRSVFAYVLMHELTHQVFPMSFQGHGDPFPDMLCIMCVAGYELRIFDLKNIPKKTVYSNGQEITSRGSLTSELLRGIELLREANPDSSEYYNQLESVIKSDNSF